MKLIACLLAYLSFDISSLLCRMLFGLYYYLTVSMASLKSLISFKMVDFYYWIYSSFEVIRLVADWELRICLF
jgi:hypothetical protein